MKAILVKMQCITNLHVGSGDVNYNIIDNEVERDPVTGYPTINSSGVKGALKQFFSQLDSAKVKDWFGDDNKNEGHLKILPAELVAMPARASKGKKAFYLVSPQSSIARYNQVKINFGIRDEFSNGDDYTDGADVEAEVEGISVGKSITIAGDTVYSMADDKFRMIGLPVVSRNHLVNGISDNLWYEEIVPHHSTFVFPVVVRNTNEDMELLNDFKQAITDKIVQFGGNASIGYGLCRLSVTE